MSFTVARLPEHLRERTLAISTGELQGSYVVYWARGAMRAWENPALDVALVAARELGLPLLVHQALSERYPWANDRHHTFIMEGVVDFARDLASRNITYRFHLERKASTREPVTRKIAENAALVVAEDLPIQPMRRWLDGLASSVSTPVWSVDTACVVPSALIRRAHERAFQFRRAIQDHLDARIGLPWPEQDDPQAPWEPTSLPYPHTEVRPETLADLVALCDIDHSVGPVSDTRGGSKAGYARWNRFCRSGGLKRYASSRNDATRDGVSRMSAYLHHGMVAPTRLAREAYQAGGKGGDKYLDELIIWRELAWNYCRKVSHHDSVRALPGWAQDTLNQHRSDPRPALYDLDTLSRGQTHDPLWNACQKSLLTHGELHNNVRMTWGKAILQWTDGPDEALFALRQLNHRYALDGRDPASYGGLLWCLGGFDRPFSPEQPVLGSVRPRPTEGHASRMNLERYIEHVNRPLYRQRPRVAVVGAGVSGAFCARILSDHGIDVQVFDKGRGAGGRLSTRRFDTLRFDHGAIAMGQVSPSIQRYIDAWMHAGVLSRWDAPAIRVQPDGTTDVRRETQLVATPGMSHLVKYLLRDLPVRFSTRVVALNKQDNGKTDLRFEDGTCRDFDAVVIAIPAPQAADLLRAERPHLATALDAVTYEPAWVGMFGLTADLDKRWGMSTLERDPVIQHIVRNQSKPGRPEPEQLVVHCTPEWSRANLERDRESVEKDIWTALSALLPVSDPIYSAAHRWRYSQVVEPVGTPCMWEDRLGVCGDCMTGGGISGALTSGSAMAGRILGAWHTSEPNFGPHTLVLEAS